MNKIDDLIDSLSWNNDVATQKYAINQIIKIIDDEDIGLLIQPRDDKSCWENAALALKGIGSPKIHKEIPKLLEWLADLNWPGAIIVLELLATIDKEILIPYVNIAKEKAGKECDEMWLDALEQLLEQIQ